MPVLHTRPPWIVCIALVLAAVLKLQAADGPLSSSAVIQAVSSAMQASGLTTPFISPEFGLDAPALGPAWHGQFVPAIAFNGTHYLVVWSDERNAPDSALDIYAARVTANGAVLDTNGFPICAAALEQGVPAVAASGGEFLVAWIDRRSGSPAIYAANVTTEGTVRQPDGIFIQSNGSYVKVAANGTGFLLVWQNYSTVTGYDILGAMLSHIVNPGVPAFVISARPGWEHSPDVAASGSDYLVVWQDNRNSTGDPQDIYGARVTANGDVLDPNGFAIATGSWDQSAPAVAGNGSNYLVLWEDRRNSFNADIYGTRVSLAGAVLDTSFLVGVGDGSNAYLRSAKVAALASTYLVVWDSPSGYRARTVSSAGIVANTSEIVVPSAFHVGSGLAAGTDRFLFVWDGSFDIFGTHISSLATRQGDDFLISSGPNAQQAPAVAFNGSTYLVVWEDSRNADGDIYGVRVAADGNVLDSTAIAICRSPGYQFSPAVAALNGDFLVVWADSSDWTSGTDIYGARVQADGFVLDPVGFPISTSLHSQRAVAVSANRDHYLVVWRDNRNCPNCQFEPADIFAARVTPAGTVLDSAGIPVSLAAGSQEAPAVASNGDDFLVVWRDDRDRLNPNVYGALLRAGAVIAPDIAISTAAGHQRGPEVSSDGSDFLVVWRDERNLSTTDSDIRGARVDRNGLLLDTNSIVISSTPHRQVEAAIAFGGANYFVAWQEFRAANTTQIYGTRVSPSGVALDSPGLLINPGKLTDSVLGVASAGDDNFLIVSQGFRRGAPRALANVVSIAAHRIICFRVQPASVTICWRSEPGRTYYIDYKPTLTTKEWIPVSGGIVAQGTDASWTGLRPAGSTAFYRVVMLAN